MAIRYVNTTDTIGDIGAFDSRLVFGDFDNDGDIDVLYQANNIPGQDIGYRRNNGDGTFTDFAPGNLAGTPFASTDFANVQVTATSLYAFDYDNDGDVDLISRVNDASSILRNNAGTFATVADTIGDYGAFDSRGIYGDFDNDGDIDVLFQANNVAGQDIGFRRNNGNGTFTNFANANAAGTPFTTTNFAGIQVTNSPLFVFDYDNDGDVDIINRTNGATSIFRNDNGTFNLIADPIGDTGAFDSRIVFGDFDSDGDIDILFQANNIAGQDIGLRLNNGNGTYIIFTDARAAGSPFEGADFTGVQVTNSTLLVVDYDNDGDVDLVSRQNDASRIIKQSSNTGDGSPPTLVSSTPSDNGTGVSPTANITLTFDEAVVKGIGNIRIVRTSDGAVIETIAVGSGQVTGSGTTWTIDPNATLVGGVSYAVQVDRGSFRDSDGAIFAGIAGTTRLNFTVQAATPPVIDLNGAGAGVNNTANYTEQAVPIVLASGLTVADADSANLTGATVQITGGFVPNTGAGGDFLGINGSVSGTINGINYSYGAGTGILTLSGSATVAAYQTVLSQVTFQSTSDNPGTLRSVTWTVNDGTANSAAATTTIAVTAVNDPPVNTVPGSQSGTEDINLVFSVANGNAISVRDADAASLTVTLSLLRGTVTLASLNGITIDSGANGSSFVRFSGTAADINAALNGLVYRGPLNYNGFEQLTITTTDNGQTGQGGARSDSDTINITLAPDGTIDGTSGDNVLSGTPQNDLFLLQQGGADTVNGGDGNDGFYFGGAYTSADIVDGGAGNLDQIGLQGSYAGGVTLGSIAGVEMIVLLPGNDTRFGDNAGNSYSYSITSPDASVAAGQTLIVQANTLRAGENFTFNGSAETNGSFLIYGGFGIETLTGGAGNDAFFFGQGRFGASDTVNGGAGTMDQLGLQGNFTGGSRVTFGASQLTSIEGIVVLSASDNRFGAVGGTVSYELVMNDGNVAAGQRMLISANTLQASEYLDFNGSAETNGAFDIYSGNGNDVITGGSGADLIFGGGRGDTLTGGGGNDVFAYNRLTDSNSNERDGIQDFTLGDKIDLSRLDANAGLAGRQDFLFVGTSAFSGSAGELRYENISLGGPIFLIQGDVDGNGVSDFEVVVVVTDGRQIAARDFIGVTAPQQTELKPLAEDFAMPDQLHTGFDAPYSHHVVLPPVDLAL